MQFRMEFSPKPFELKLKHSDKLLLAGSCFTEQIGAKLKHHKFSTIENPNGILFNPVSIAQSISSYISNKQYTEADLFFHHELWGSWDHHTKFSALQSADCLNKINQSQQQAHDFLQKTDWLLLTLGSSFAYRLEDKRVVANCHKVPADKFNKRLMPVDEIKEVLANMIASVRLVNPSVKFIFTISPVRHLREGFIENNRSKANLIQSVHELVDSKSVFYFPAYELVIDDLRDYRFYAEDLVHPNYSATNYVWDKFIATCIDDESQQLIKEVNIINAARHHKAFNPHSEAHKQFLQLNLDKVNKIKQEHPYLDLSEEEKYFAS